MAWTRRRRWDATGVALLGAVALAMAAAPTLAQAPGKTVRVALLASGGRTPDGQPPRALREALRPLGCVEGQHVVYEARFAEGRLDRLPALAAELVRRKVDVIVAQGGMAARAAKRATATIPIVVAPASGDLVATGLIAGLARPGGNVTGLSDESVQLSAKRMEILKEAIPQAARMAVLRNAGDEGMTLRYREIERAARVLGVEVQALGVREPADFPGAFAAMTRQRPDALFVVTDALTNVNRRMVLEFAATQRIPAMYELSVFVRDGGFMSYGPSAEDMFGRAAAHIDRILKGVRPGELPAEQPTRYYLTLNLKAAAALGLAVPPALLLRADDVVQ